MLLCTVGISDYEQSFERAVLVAENTMSNGTIPPSARQLDTDGILAFFKQIRHIMSRVEKCLIVVC